MKHKGLICAQVSIDIKVQLEYVWILFEIREQMSQMSQNIVYNR